jgi:predicted transglutaminase-like cysteine proteinase
MIKAEIISHEGNPGPNWLDRCRSVATPASVTTVALLIVGGALFVGLAIKDRPKTANQLTAAGASQQAPQSAATGLQVQPLSKVTTTSDSGSTTVQSATGGNTAPTAPATQGNTAAPISAAQTPALNNSNTSNNRNQTPIDGRNLTNKLQSTVQDVQKSVNRTLNGLTGGLGL